MKRYCSHKEWNAEVKKWIGRGWVYERGGKHGRLIDPNSSIIMTIPCSPSDRNSLKWFRSKMNKRANTS